jgi:methylthioribose-1-phosphate isomerase
MNLRGTELELDQLPSIVWQGSIDGSLDLLDQTLLPLEQTRLLCESPSQVFEAIVMLRVRGAPAIGIAAAYGVCLSLRPHLNDTDSRQAKSAALECANYLATSRPTAVNLFWALDRTRSVINRHGDSEPARVLAEKLLTEAQAIHDQDRTMCHAIGRFGAELLKDGYGVLTHCNAGGLATAEYGTALSAIFTAHDQGKRLKVYADETRPLLQGARLTAWELQRHGVDCTLICDSMAAQVMHEGKIQAIIVGADRITARGDTANKIGTMGVAILAAYHKIPFYVAAPTSTFDLQLTSGSDIPIEQRKSTEITEGFGRRTAPQGIHVYNPAFDVTPAELIHSIVTERGVIHPVNESTVRAMVS